MYFKSVSLENFRNYGRLSLEFDRNLNLFLGQNAQGKTNLLESLFIMGLGKSFRTNNDREMINFKSDRARVSSTVIDEDRETEIQIDYSGEGKIIRVDGIKLDRAVDLLENVYVVIFSPDDLKIIKEGPDNRRRFLDRELCQIKPVYYSDLGNYKKVLKQRNMLLRQNSRDEALFAVFDEALCDYGLRIIEERERFTERICDISNKIHSDISGGKENLKISYETKLSSKPGSASRAERKEEYRGLLDSHFQSDLMKGYTGFGPHKDDLKIETDGIDIRMYGSQGQQRTAALSMKLAEIDLIKQETGKNAVLLLDDVLSELDYSRQRYLVESMSGVQVFITTTEIDEKLLSMLPKGKTFNVSDGNVLT